MDEMTVKLTWDGESLGPGWMNIDNLKACLYGEQHTLPDLCNVEVVESIPASA